MKSKEEILRPLLSDLGYNYDNLKTTEGFANKFLTLAEAAMEAYASQFASDTEVGMRWVKASERLPDKLGYYHVKTLFFRTIYATGCQYSPEHKMWGSGLDGNVVEWLDECVSSPPSVEKQPEKEIEDLQNQVRRHIKEDKLFIWEEGLLIAVKRSTLN